MPETQITPIRFTATQKRALQKEADRRGIYVSELVSEILAQHVPDFKYSGRRKGKYERKTNSDKPLENGGSNA